MNNKRGFMLLEIIIAVALISIAFVVLLGVSVQALNISNSVQKETQADSLMTDEFEALRSFRDGTQWGTNGLGTVATGNNNPYHLASNAGAWTLVPGAETTGIFTRQIVVDKVSRDPGTQNIEATYNAAHDDKDTRKIAVTIMWSGKTLQDVSYFTNWK